MFAWITCICSDQGGTVCSHGLQKFITFSMPPNVVTFPKTLEAISYHMSLFMKFDFSIATNVWNRETQDAGCWEIMTQTTFPKTGKSSCLRRSGFFSYDFDFLVQQTFLTKISAISFAVSASPLSWPAEQVLGTRLKYRRNASRKAQIKELDS